MSLVDRLTSSVARQCMQILDSRRCAIPIAKSIHVWFWLGVRRSSVTIQSFKLTAHFSSTYHNTPQTQSLLSLIGRRTGSSLFSRYQRLGNCGLHFSVVDTETWRECEEGAKVSTNQEPGEHVSWHQFACRHRSEAERHSGTVGAGLGDCGTGILHRLRSVIRALRLR